MKTSTTTCCSNQVIQVIISNKLREYQKVSWPIKKHYLRILECEQETLYVVNFQALKIYFQKYIAVIFVTVCTFCICLWNNLNKLTFHNRYDKVCFKISTMNKIHPTTDRSYSLFLEISLVLHWEKTLKSFLFLSKNLGFFPQNENFVLKFFCFFFPLYLSRYGST